MPFSLAETTCVPVFSATLNCTRTTLRPARCCVSPIYFRLPFLPRDRIVPPHGKQGRAPLRTPSPRSMRSLGTTLMAPCARYRGTTNRRAQLHGSPLGLAFRQPSSPIFSIFILRRSGFPRNIVIRWSAHARPRDASIAQLVEHRSRKAGVIGSSPIAGSMHVITAAGFLAAVFH